MNDLFGIEYQMLKMFRPKELMIKDAQIEKVSKLKEQG